MQRLARAVRDDRAHVEPSCANRVGHANIDGAFWNAVAVHVLFVARLTGSTAAWRGDLGVNVGEEERVRGNRGRFTRPRGMAGEAQLKRSEEPCLAEVIAGEPLVLRALASSVHDKQRLS